MAEGKKEPLNLNVVNVHPDVILESLDKGGLRSSILPVFHVGRDSHYHLAFDFVNTRDPFTPPRMGMGVKGVNIGPVRTFCGIELFMMNERDYSSFPSFIIGSNSGILLSEIATGGFYGEPLEFMIDCPYCLEYAKYIYGIFSGNFDSTGVDYRKLVNG